MEEVKELTECPICIETFTDPRILPCVHSFCLICLEKIQSISNGQEEGKMSCPICRTEFIIPKEGLAALKKNFFMRKLIEIAKILKPAEKICEVCLRQNEEASDKMPEATKYCIECSENMCDRCSARHKSYKVSNDHHIMPFGEELREEVTRNLTVQFCDEHCKEEIKLYCKTCEKVICMMCFARHHKVHECIETNEEAETFLKKLDNDIEKVVACSAECIGKMEEFAEKKKELMKMAENAERAIVKRASDMKELIDIEMQSLLEELSTMKKEKLKALENEEQGTKEIKKLLKSLRTYCDELKSKGSPVEICQSVNAVHERADALGKMHKEAIERDIPSVKVSFTFSKFEEFANNENIIGQLEADRKVPAVKENKAVIVGINDGISINSVVCEFSLNRPNDVSFLQSVPTTMKMEAAVVTYSDNLFVIGIGKDADEIWKFNRFSGWIQCPSLVEGRNRHCANYICHAIVICGGFVESQSKILKSVEAYDLLSNKCTTVGELAKGIESFATAAYKGLIYVFGGVTEGDEETNCVQIYNTIDNTCSLFSKSLPSPSSLLRAVSWKSSVILVGPYNCFMFDFETAIFQERKQFKTDVSHFGLVIDDKEVYVFGGGTSDEDREGNWIWKCRDDIRYLALSDIIKDKNVEWKHYGRMLKPTAINSYTLLVSRPL